MFSTPYIKITGHLSAICLRTQLDNLSRSLIVVAVDARVYTSLVGMGLRLSALIIF